MSRRIPTLILLALLASPHAEADPSWPTLDLTLPGARDDWRQQHDIRRSEVTPDGLSLALGSFDPYLTGPVLDFPSDQPAWLWLRLKSDTGGTGEVYAFREAPQAGAGVAFQAPPGRWTDVRIPLPALGPAHRIRIDPPGHGGQCVIASLRFEQRRILPEPEWPAWVTPPPATDRLLSAGLVELWSDTSRQTLDLRVDGHRMARLLARPRIGYLRNGEVCWIDLADSPATIEPTEHGVTLMVRGEDADGAAWTWRQSLASDREGAITVSSSLGASADRDLVFAPMALLIAGEGTFGHSKHQAILPGLEYLDDEPSRSLADIEGPEANRRTPAPHKLTLPLMAVQADDRYIGLVWDDHRAVTALFDSPDRTFGSGGHALGLLLPGFANGSREEGRLLPYAPQRLPAGTTITARARIIGGRGHSVVPAVQHAIRLRGWPDPPHPAPDFKAWVDLAARGWLESKIRDGNRYRHAFWPGFSPQPAADAAVFQHWLANRHPDSSRRQALREAARLALEAVDPRHRFGSGVGHIRLPAAPLAFGDPAALDAAIDDARDAAQRHLARLEADGTVIYQARPGAPDYARTHAVRHANGLTAQVVASALEAAVFAGDASLIARALDAVRRLDQYAGGVPRGAQTWEIPLHTPDLLASAHLARAYTLAFELTRDSRFLEQAVYWAWTGVPFVYLVDPTDQPIGRWSTIAVLGATNWQAPVWFGRPVQWCGLVYADALLQLAVHDREGPWQRMANGITLAGLQHTWPADDPDRAGLLPDYFELADQLRSGPAINPGTLGAVAARLFETTPILDRKALPRGGLILHAAGEIRPLLDEPGHARVEIRAWSPDPHLVLVHGLSGPAVVRLNDEATPTAATAAGPHLAVPVHGSAQLDIRWTPSGQ